MCGIAGILSKNGENVAPIVGMMLSRMARRGPDGAGMAADDALVRADSVQMLAAAGVRGSCVLGHARLAIVGGSIGSQPFRSCDGRLVLEHNGEIYNYKQLRAKLEAKSKHTFQTMTDSEVIVHLLEDYLAQGLGLEAAIKKAVPRLDGIYALAVKDNATGQVALVRDPLGVRPLYWAENGRFVAFASERKGLWEAGVPEPTRRVLPGHALMVSPAAGAVSQVRVAPLLSPNKKNRRPSSISTMRDAVAAYEKALMASMKKRTQDVERIGIIFSGGIDSVLVAHIAKMMVPEVACYTAGVKGSSDLDHARAVADSLGLRLYAHELEQDEIEGLVPRIIKVIEDSNAGQVEVALPVYCAVRLASSHGMRIMLTGQGADELFGGYSWYPHIARRYGYGRLRAHMLDDLMLLYKETLEREDKITMAHSVELREPFLDRGVIRTAMDMDLRLNVRKEDMFGKRVHRNLACRLGVPKEIAYRVKEAAQHGSGVHSAIDAIARKNGFDEDAVTAGYLRILESKEKVGSSQRYGYLFEKEKKMWIAEPHVQMYLDSLIK
ncbi:asparagine synthase (glutamine-hydrolyzing) [Nitrososphaera sp.]|uniref:asparagine synthase (glutamine-hydrolyzing) n=1 Tax=Nitrososphaera sp. TaxID=1971748 RepID=UPI00307ED488